MRSRLVLLLLLTGLVGLSASPTAAQGPVFTLKEFNPQDQTFAPPTAGANAVLLTPGQAFSLNCPAAPEGGGILCAPQFAITVPAGSTGLQFRAQASADFIVFMRVDQEVAIQDGRAVSDFAFRSANGQADFFVPAFEPGSEFPGLVEGRYFFAVAHFEAAAQRFSVTGSASTPKPLTTQAPAQLGCTAFELMCIQQLVLDVREASPLRLEVRGQGGFQLHARFGQPVTLPPLTFNDQGFAQFGTPLSDVSATADGGLASLALDGASSPPLRVGRYFVALFNLENFDQTFTVTVSSSGAPGRRPPLAEFGFSPAAPRVGQTVNFNDRSSDPDGQLRSWLWDFGDGQSSTEQNPSHSYAAPGTYRVSLLVTNDANLSTAATQTLTVSQAPPAPTAGGLRAVAFSELSLVDPAVWQRTFQDGCVIYTNTSEGPAHVELVGLDGTLRAFEVAAGDAVLVCGNVAHFG